MTRKALIFLASGVEETEFAIAVDVLIKGGIDVTISGVPECELVKGGRGIQIQPDASLAESINKGPFDVIVLPGGLGGAKILAESNEVGELLKKQEANGKIIAAICAGPLALKAHGIGQGKNITSYPAIQNEFLEGGNGYQYKEDKVVVDGTLITSRGPGTAFDFALAIVEKLQGKEKAVEVAKGLLLA